MPVPDRVQCWECDSRAVRTFELARCHKVYMCLRCGEKWTDWDIEQNRGELGLKKDEVKDVDTATQGE